MRMHEEEWSLSFFAKTDTVGNHSWSNVRGNPSSNPHAEPGERGGLKRVVHAFGGVGSRVQTVFCVLCLVSCVLWLSGLSYNLGSV